MLVILRDGYDGMVVNSMYVVAGLCHCRYLKSTKYLLECFILLGAD